VLYSLQVAPFPSHPDNPVAGFVERERLRCIADLISFLRARTGQDLGDKPDPGFVHLVTRLSDTVRPILQTADEYDHAA
jgi:hypothetical protein